MPPLTETEVCAETERLLKRLAWASTQAGIDYHVVDIGTQSTYGILAGLLEDLVNDGVDHGYNPAYVVGYLMLRMWGQHPEYRKDIRKIVPDFDKLDDVQLTPNER